jgi:DnaJ-domain-containing protein 1
MPSTSQPATHQTRFTKPKNVTSSSPKSTLTKLEEKCRRIVESKDYYDILNVSRHADTEEIKKAYRKVVL